MNGAKVRVMESARDCPHLPTPTEHMTWRHLAQWRGNEGGEFYQTALTYGQFLWRQQLSARALLAVDRGLYANLQGEEAELAQWPLPYRAIGWLVANNPDDTFIGNPRVHYQHLADRVRGERADQKKWRAWAAWAVVRAVAPDYPNDPKHDVVEPSISEIENALAEFGIPGEVAMWQAAL
ncbi:hypothetical protein [Cerasicoccus maritimus]|uniref:hypothetical protein n=1 Tax=Cerasicoccus maritimus TaxID=490089 RepID=UPI002852B2FA|nr:hypothetical protein [Cerasicoccus maritimus]